MAYNSKKVEKMVRSKGLSIKEYYDYVYPDRSESTKSSLSDIKRVTNPKADTVERIADLLECSIDELFDRSPKHLNNSMNSINGDNNSLNINSDPEMMVMTINHLRDIIERQDKTIENYQKQVDMLINLAQSNQSSQNRDMI